MRRELCCWRWLLLAVGVVVSFSAHADRHWVEGRITRLEDYAGYNANFGVLVELAEQEWFGAGNGATNCTHRFNLRVGVLGMTEASLNRIYSLLLSSYIASKRVRLYIDDNDYQGYCDVQIGSVADSYQ
ncbi:MAG: hypothetical protein AAGA68_02480 [Pseudomonadota bacterium]